MALQVLCDMCLQRPPTTLGEPGRSRRRVMPRPSSREPRWNSVPDRHRPSRRGDWRIPDWAWSWATWATRTESCRGWIGYPDVTDRGGRPAPQGGRRRDWHQRLPAAGYAANFSIGQGDVAVTLLQVAVMHAVIANGRVVLTRGGLGRRPHHRAALDRRRRLRRAALLTGSTAYRALLVVHRAARQYRDLEAMKDGPMPGRRYGRGVGEEDLAVVLYAGRNRPRWVVRRRSRRAGCVQRRLGGRWWTADRAGLW